jgi:hypothetical protein
VLDPAVKGECDSIQAQRDALLARARVASEELRGDGVEGLPPLLGACLPAGRGAWALVVDDVAEVTCRDGCARVAWHPARVLPGGKIVAGKGEVDVFPRRGLEIAAASFDWDGDGEAELLVHRSRVHVSCDAAAPARDEQGGAWRFHQESITPFEAPARPGGRGPFVPRVGPDLDGDGRPDIATLGPYTALLEPPCRGSLPDVSRVMALEGPPLAARAMPGGTFSFDDPAALAETRKACPGRPVTLVSPITVEKLALDRTARHVVCARLWGVPAQQLTAALDKDRALICRDRPASGTGDCPALAALRAWASLDPPFLFP